MARLCFSGRFCRGLPWLWRRLAANSQEKEGVRKVVWGTRPLAGGFPPAEEPGTPAAAAAAASAWSGATLRLWGGPPSSLTRGLHSCSLAFLGEHRCLHFKSQFQVLNGRKGEAAYSKPACRYGRCCRAQRRRARLSVTHPHSRGFSREPRVSDACWLTSRHKGRSWGESEKET